MFLKRQTKTLSALPRGPVEYLVVGLGNPAATMKTPVTTRASWPSTPSPKSWGPKSTDSNSNPSAATR